MASHGPEEIRRLLALVDRELDAPAEITVIGGAAIGLRWDPAHSTSDVDLTPTPDERFWSAVGRARARMAPAVPVQPVGIYQAPYAWEERRVPLRLPGLRRLTVLLPEAHDLALMKVARGLTHDLQAIEDVHRASPLSLATLVERFHETRTQRIGSMVELKLSFLALVERLFGPEKAKEVERGLDSPPPVRSI